MSREEIITYWKKKMEERVLLSPSMCYLIEQTIKYLEEK